MINCFLNQSIVKRALEGKLVTIEVINLRDFAKDKHKTVDDQPYGGGAGMILKIDCIKAAIDNFKIRDKVILTSPRGKIYNQSLAKGYSKLNHLILIAGHYEGVDERVLKYVDEEVSLGDFVMTGGEIAVVAIVDSVVRLLPGVLKKNEAIKRESFFTVSVDQLIKVVGKHKLLVKLKKSGVLKVTLLEYPQYTRPEIYQKHRVPDVLLSGHHAQIEAWRLNKAFEATLKRRKDLLER